MKKTLTSTRFYFLNHFGTLVIFLLINLAALSQSGTQLTFVNPVLVSGTANQQGAIYRFSNITTGVDAEVKLKKFSRATLVMTNIDNSSTGYNQAFQPEFGLPGLILPLQNWYIDFEMIFYRAGTNTKQRMDTVKLTSIDLDGDNNSVSEYVTYDNPNTISYSPITYLTNAPAGILGQVLECGEDNILSALMACPSCGGDGWIGAIECPRCDGSGKLHTTCRHAYEGGSGRTVSGPVNNFVSIDTAATQVMATYQFFGTDRIRYRSGAKTGALSSNGSGVRLNSTWFRGFSLGAITTLPVKLETFTAMLNNNKADLKWTTSSEINVSHFVIEKSLDGRNFTDAGMMFAYGNNANKTNYNFSDNVSGQTGVIYYRLCSVDIDGKKQYSDTRVIRMGKSLANTISIITYPNPATSELRITIPNNWQNKKVTYTLYSGNGATARQTIAPNASQTETVNMSSLAPGFYVIKVSCDGEMAQQKIVKN